MSFKFGDSIQLFATLGVLIGIVLVFYEVRENNRIALNQAAIEINSLYNEWSNVLLDEDLVELFVRSLEDPDSLTRVELLQLSELYLTALQTFQAQHYLATRGGSDMYPDSTLYTDASMVLSGPVARRFVEMSFENNDSDSARIIKQAIDDTPSQTLLMFLDALNPTEVDTSAAEESAE